ncbi:MAG: Flp pilus assembly protein CpaB [Rhodobiaceae bacterium]|nr:Flp pilus assembly protein CpaB [Rhodobiaceae bacterium]MCC0055143.1 Flp pilus assembly protein CpaB [Rhodobiaceae bacterium]
MNKARIAVLGVALVAGVVAWRMASSVDTKAPVVMTEAPKVDTVNVLVANKDITPGQAIASGDLRWEAWPKGSANDAFVTKESSPDAMEEFTGAVARGAFFDGEPMRQAKIVKAGRGGYLSALLPSGMRAISTKTSPQTGAGGFILPNDRVDVILTRRERRQTAAGDDQETYVSETVLENVRVLAIDQTVEEKDGNQNVVGNVATLELNGRQAEILALAEQLGDLSLALRSILDGKDGLNADGTQAGDQLLGGRRGGGVTVVKYGISRQVVGAN